MIKPIVISQEDLEQSIKNLNLLVSDARNGLPESVFLMVSRLTPLINVDLLIKNKNAQTLLTWRDDEFYGPGWHVPGGIVRFKETIINRMKQVALTELGVNINDGTGLLSINQLFAKDRDIRGHFISLLYSCELDNEPDPIKMARSSDEASHGEWFWHSRCPDNLIAVHDIYKKFIL